MSRIIQAVSAILAAQPPYVVIGFRSSGKSNFQKAMGYKAKNALVFGSTMVEMYPIYSWPDEEPCEDDDWEVAYSPNIVSMAKTVMQHIWKEWRRQLGKYPGAKICFVRVDPKKYYTSKEIRTDLRQLAKDVTDDQLQEMTRNLAAPDANAIKWVDTLQSEALRLLEDNGYDVQVVDAVHHLTHKDMLDFWRTPGEGDMID